MRKEIRLSKEDRETHLGWQDLIAWSRSIVFLYVNLCKTLMLKTMTLFLCMERILLLLNKTLDAHPAVLQYNILKPKLPLSWSGKLKEHGLLHMEDCLGRVQSTSLNSSLTLISLLASDFCGRRCTDKSPWPCSSPLFSSNIQHHLFALETPRNHIQAITLATHNSACQLLLAL